MTLLLLPLQLLAFVFSKKLSRTIPVLWHKFVLYVVGVKVHVHGTVSTIRPLMLVSNHISWSDILILGSVMPLSFIAKDEVKSWPGINYLAKLQRTVF
ncbi:MAG: 1-acyl-sn-glycerol-3-phosphate acyltransferase, partial [Nitratireductor sp.]